MSRRLYLPDYWEGCKPAHLRARLAAIAPGLGQVLPAADPALAALALTRDARAVLLYDYDRLEALILRHALAHTLEPATLAELRGALHRGETLELAGTWAPRVVRGLLTPLASDGTP